MKNLFFVLTIAGILTSCANTSNQTAGQAASRAAGENSVNFSEVTGKEWKLTEVRINGVNTGFDRISLENEGFGEMFTLSFNAETVSGIGAPNRYSAPYTLAEGRSISIMMLRSTLMAAFREPEKLKEHDFFTYVQNAYSWNLTNSNLELNSKTADGAEVILVFSP